MRLKTARSDSMMQTQAVLNGCNAESCPSGLSNQAMLQDGPTTVDQALTNSLPSLARLERYLRVASRQVHGECAKYVEAQ